MSRRAGRMTHTLRRNKMNLDRMETVLGWALAFLITAFGIGVLVVCCGVAISFFV